MIFKHILLLTGFFAVFQGAAQETINIDGGKEEELIGQWQIDLRPTPDSEAYYQDFVVDALEGNVLKGSFYGSPIEAGLINKSWPNFYFAFTTNDATHAYYHSGYLKEGKLYGTSYCPGRAFIARWTGERKP